MSNSNQQHQNSVAKLKALSKCLVAWLEDHQLEFQSSSELELNVGDALELACLLHEEVNYLSTLNPQPLTLVAGGKA